MALRVADQMGIIPSTLLVNPKGYVTSGKIALRTLTEIIRRISPKHHAIVRQEFFFIVVAPVLQNDVRIGVDRPNGVGHALE